MSKKTKIFVGIVLGLAALIGAMSFFGGSTSTPEENFGPVRSGTGGTLATSTTMGGIPGGGPLPSQGSGLANEFSGLLLSINTISIDTSIFQNPSYRALRDYPVILGTDVVGRVNPFAPIGSDIGQSTAADTVSVQTVSVGKITTVNAEFGAVVTMPETAAATVVFQYGTTDTFGMSSTPVNITKTGTVLTTVAGLLPATKYFVQAVVVRGSSTTLGTVVTFTTAGTTTL